MKGHSEESTLETFIAQDIQSSGQYNALSSHVVSSLHKTAPPGLPLPHVAKHMLPERT